MRYRKTTVGALAIATSLAVAAPSGATVIERYWDVDEPYAFTNTDCVDATYDVEGVFTGQLILRQAKGPADQAFPYVERFSIVETWTNPETGGWFTLSGHMLRNEVKARPVSGTVFEFRMVETGRLAVTSSAGELVARDAGAAMVTFLFDTLGDSAPGGDYDWDSFVVDHRGPHDIGDLCALAAELT